MPFHCCYEKSDSNTSDLDKITLINNWFCLHLVRLVGNLFYQVINGKLVEDAKVANT